MAVFQARHTPTEPRPVGVLQGQGMSQGFKVSGSCSDKRYGGGFHFMAESHQAAAETRAAGMGLRPVREPPIAVDEFIRR